MASSSVIFKVFLRSDGSPEARKFIIDDASVITSFVFIKGKLAMVFPKLNNTPFKITWKDNDGDEITIDSDEDLIMAFTEMIGPVKTLYVTLLPSQHVPHTPVSMIYCDGCNRQITGYRYKCLQCPDFDLCSNCEQAGHHSDHYMLRSSNGELPFGAACKRVADGVNKTIRKAQAMAFKEACRTAKANRKFEKKFEHHGRRERACQYEEAGPSCPMTAPLFDLVNAAAQAAYTSFGPMENPEPAKEPPKEQPEPSPTPQQPQHFVEVMMKALSNIFPEQKNGGPSTSGENVTKTPTTTPVNERSPQEAVPEQSPQAPIPEQSPTPMEEDAPENAKGAVKNSSWTILDHDISIQNSPQEAPAAAVGPSAPPSPPLDPKIMSGLKQMRDMGFGDHPNLVALLKRYDGNVGNVIRHMFDHI